MLPTVLAVVLSASGFSVPVMVPLVVGVAIAVAFFFVPDLSVRRKADQRRAELRRALGCYLDLVSMSMAGGRGVPEALPTAAAIGRG